MHLFQRLFEHATLFLVAQLGDVVYEHVYRRWDVCQGPGLADCFVDL